MKNTRSSKGQKKFLLGYIIIICCILNSAYALSTTDLKIYSRVVLLVTFVLLLTNNILKKEIKIKVDNSIKVYLALMIGFIFSISFNFSYETVSYSLTIFLTITVALMITRYVEYNTFIQYYIRIMKVLTVISLIAWILVMIIGVDWLPKIINVNGEIYVNGYLFFFNGSNTDTFYSNMSIFWEPGIFASFLIIALIFETCFKEGKENKTNIIIFLAGLLSTQSSAGYALLLLYLAIRISKSKGRLKFLGILFILSVFTLVTMWGELFSEWLLNWNYDMFYKFYSIQNSTTGTRLYSPIINLKIFQDSPLFGLGFYDAERQYVDIMNSTFDVFFVEAQTSTSAVYMASLGLLGLLYTVAWIIPLLKMKKIGNFISRALILLTFLLIINKEPHTNILITYCVLFYILSISNKNYKSRLVEVSDDEQDKNASKLV